MIQELEANIRAVVQLGRRTATGFETLKCPICNDHKVRAGFKFSHDEIGYNCFRGKCGAAMRVSEGGHLSRDFRSLMQMLGVELPSVVFLSTTTAANHNVELYEQHTYKKVDLPSNFFAITKESAPLHYDYLIRRRMNPSRFAVAGPGEMAGRIIIPCFYGKTLIGWQGCDISGHQNAKKYLSSSGNTDLMFFPDGQVPDEPILFEGAFDACSVPDGIACFHSKLTKKQAYFLRNKDPIVVPDRHSSNLLEVAERYRWRVSLPEWNCNDANAAIQAYGKYVTARMINDGLCGSIWEARTKYKMWADNK